MKRSGVGVVASLLVAGLAASALGCDGVQPEGLEADPFEVVDDQERFAPVVVYTVEITITTGVGELVPMWTIYNFATGVAVAEGAGPIPAAVAAQYGISEIAIVETAGGATVTATGASGGIASTVITATGVATVVVGGGFLIYETYQLTEETEQIAEQIAEGIHPPPGVLDCAGLNVFSSEYWECVGTYWGMMQTEGPTHVIMSEPAGSGNDCCCDLRNTPHHFEWSHIIASEDLCQSVGGELIPGTCGSALPTNPDGSPIPHDDREAQRAACSDSCIDQCMQEENAYYEMCEAECSLT